MPEVRIYRPAKNAMQSGRANCRHWVVEFEPSDRKQPDPLMGWNGSRDTRGQLRLRFETKEEAVAFAKREGYAYSLTEDRPAKAPVPKNYADNFRFDRVG
ncbi:MAG TPA: ETC complex I subunit [Rhodospirillaceae bacterium]|nr:ETC complex I subunit [Rhodospirillaceae bacterium]